MEKEAEGNPSAFFGIHFVQEKEKVSRTVTLSVTVVCYDNRKLREILRKGEMG